MSDNPLLNYSILADPEQVASIVRAQPELACQRAEPGAGLSDTPLQRACDRNYTQTALILLSIPGIEVNVSNQWDRTPLMDACRNVNTEIVQALLGVGAKVDGHEMDGNTALTQVLNAVDWGEIPSRRDAVGAIALQLIGHGCDTQAADSDGVAPFCLAAEMGLPAVMEAIYASNPQAALLLHDQALFNAVRSDTPETIDWLLAHGWDTGVDTPGGGSLLHYAVEVEALATLDHLINLGLAPEKVNRAGWTPYALAEAGGKHDALTYFRARERHQSTEQGLISAPQSGMSPSV